MAKKKKETLSIHVKNPKIGKQYYFRFAGSIWHGTLTEKDDKLTSHYGVNWYTLEDKRGYKYPVSIHWIAEDPKLISNV